MAESHNWLKNSGIAFLASADTIHNSDAATIVVVGVPRSGTSMVAKCLRALNVSIGAKADQAVHEDIEIAAALEGRDERLLRRLIAARNSTHMIWGFKRPTAFRLINHFIGHFRNPRFVVTFRDPVAVAKRNEISMRIDFLRALQTATTHMNELIRFVTDLKHPAMLVSYEKALIDPESFTTSLASFCGLRLSPDVIQRAAATVEMGPPQYLEASRLRFEGCLGRVENGIAFGWARQIGQRKPQTVLVLEKGREVGRGEANHYRVDLAKRNKEDGYCAFAIRLARSALRKSDVIAKIANTNYELRK